MSLRSTLVMGALLLATLTLVVSCVLVGVTTLLNRTTRNAVASLESVRLAEGAKADLLLHERSTDELVRRDFEERLRNKLAAAHEHLTSAREAEVIQTTESRLRTFIARSRAEQTSLAELAAHRAELFESLEELVAVNLSEARASGAAARRWDRIANVAGLSVSALIIVGVVWLTLWLKREAFAPVFSLGAAMERFRRGDREARAREDGPAELAAMGQAFNQMAATLSAQRREQMAFLGGVAHDLRNPLQVLKTSTALLRSDAPLPSEPALRKLVARMDRQIHLLERMVGDFLDIAKIEAGELELTSEELDARSVVGEVVSLFESAVPAGRLSFTPPDQPVPIYADRARLEQVVVNLVSNAIKYSPPTTQVELALETHEDDVVLRVTDRGVGISEEDQARLFEPFRRVGLSKDQVPGVGLGLYVVRRLVVAQGGRIEVESAVRQGSTFRVHLPRPTLSSWRDGEASESARSATPHAPSTSS
jgi:signal transduction histidine kinase